MTDPTNTPDPDAEFDTDVDAEVSAALAALLSDANVWEDFDPADEAAILDTIGSLRASSVTEEDAPPVEAGHDDNVVSISTARRWIGPFVAGIAAAVVLFAGFAFVSGGDGRDGFDLALDSTELAPEAEGVVEIVDTPNGTVLLLDVSGLPPAPEGSYYEAWLRQDAEVGVSAGTFHLRGGGGEIELWAGVTTEDYPLFTVTIQDEAEPVSSGRVVLRGLVEN